MIKTKSNNSTIYFYLYIIAFALSAIPAFFLSAPQVEDALGTMGAAAYLTGHDWGDILVEKGFFYKYGQTIYFLPIFLIIKNPAIRYKFLLMANSIVTAFIPVIIYKLSTKHLKMANEDAVFISLITGCMPGTLLYAKLTWAEPVLFLIPWLIILIVMELEGIVAALQNVSSSESDEPKGRLLNKQRLLSALLAWVSVYAFMCHQRGIVIVLGTILFLIIFRISRRVQLIHPVLFIINLALAMILDRVFNALLKLYVYRGELLKYNLLSSFFDLEIYRKMFSAKGFPVLLKSIMGWLFNSAASGIGITLLGLVVCAMCGFGLKKKGLFSPKLQTISLLGSIFYFGSFLLGLLFFFETAYGYWYGTAVERSDHLVFGRYLESTLPIMLFIGFYALIRISQDTEIIDSADRKNKLLTPLSASLFAALTIFFALVIAPVMSGVDSYVHSIMSMNICFDMTGVKLTRDVISNLPSALIIFGIISWLLYLFIILVFNKNRRRLAYLTICGLYLYIYFRSIADILYRVDSYSLTDYAQYYLTH